MSIAHPRILVHPLAGINYSDTIFNHEITYSKINYQTRNKMIQNFYLKISLIHHTK